MMSEFGTELEAVGGAFILAMTERPEEKARIKRAENVMVARAAELFTLLNEEPGVHDRIHDRLKAQADFDLAVREHTRAVLAFFDLVPSGEGSDR